MQYVKLVGALSVLVFIVLTFSISPAISALSNSYIISSTGQIARNNVTARSGSPSDIQSAINVVASAGGGNVYVPAGDFTFDYIGDYGVMVYGGVNIIGSGTAATILRSTREPPTGSTMFYLDGSNGKPIRISGIFFKGYVNATEDTSTEAVEVDSVKDFRIDHCRFEDFTSRAVGVGAGSRGIIDHCVFDNPYKERIGGDWGYGIIVWGDNIWRSMDYYLGQYDGKVNIAYIEDCTFSRCRYATAGNAGGWYVFRHNTVYISPNYGSWAKSGIDVHEGGTSWPGGRGFEAYANTFYGTDAYQQAFKVRCGGGVVFNNTISNIYEAVWLLKADWTTSEQNYVKDLYIWSNTLSNVDLPISKDGFYQENIHYFLYARPGYIPYPYPHPLTVQP